MFNILIKKLKKNIRKQDVSGCLDYKEKIY